MTSPNQHDVCVKCDELQDVYRFGTSVCCLQAHEIGTHVCDPNIHIKPLGVAFESVRFLSKSASRNNLSLQSIA